jgi:triphosphoribosyl-dephospho-CoA synthase
MPADEIVRAAFIEACRLDVATRKPGNVSIDSAGHGMSAAQFIASADAAANALFMRGATVGERILEAVRRTRDAVGCNTNLGIVLLVAPLAAALERFDPSGNPPAVDRWREATIRVLSTLDLDDARAAYRAIALANPGGLGDAPEQSVHAPPSIDLRAAMSLAAERDSIARQYANGFLDVFDTGLDALRHVSSGPLTSFTPLTPLATLDVFLAFLGGWPDSHIVRKHGLALAQSVTREARGRHDALRRAQARGGLADELKQLAAWDVELKRQGVNPGTSADLTVATLFIAGMLQTHGDVRARA